MTTTNKIEIQFRGYRAEPLFLPLMKSPFTSPENENMLSDEAQEIIEASLMGDEDEHGWCVGNCNGEEYQVRRIVELTEITTVDGFADAMALDYAQSLASGLDGLGVDWQIVTRLQEWASKQGYEVDRQTCFEVISQFVDIDAIRDAAEANEKSYYVETGPLENTQLDRDVRFATAAEAEQARSTLMSCRDRDGFAPEVMESNEPANTTFAQWNSTGW